MQGNHAATSAGKLSQTVARAPVLIFLVVAAADGDVDNKELKMFQKLLSGKKYQVLLALMQQSDVSTTEAVSQLVAQGGDLNARLAELNDAIDNAFSEESALGLKLTLLAFAHSIAEASGGFLGIFGSKVSNQEKVAMAMIAHAFGLLEQARSQPVAGTAAAPLNEVPGNLYPLLKTREWAAQAAGQVVTRAVHEGAEVRADEPAVAYAIDANETVVFVSPDRLGPALSAAALHAGAVANLEKRLAERGRWREIRFDLSDQGVGVVEGLVFAGDFYCAEALLSETTLQQAHEKLDSVFLVIAAPARGELYAANPIDPDNVDPAKLAFMINAIKPYFAGHDAPIAPTLWLSRNGRIVGHLSGADAVIEMARKAAEAERVEEEEMLVCEVSRTGDETAFGILLDVVVKDLDVMFKNLQHLIRNHATHGNRDDHFNGRLHVRLKIEDPDYDPRQQAELKVSMDDLFGFLSNQIQTLYDGSQSARTVALSYDID